MMGEDWAKVVGLWFRPIRVAARWLWACAVAALCLRLGEWLFLPGHAGMVGSFEDLRALARQAMLHDSLSLATTMLALYALWRLTTHSWPPWFTDARATWDLLLGESAPLPDWPLAARWAAGLAAAAVLSAASFAAWSMLYSGLRVLGLETVDREGFSGAAFAVLHGWTALYAIQILGLYTNSWLFRRQPTSDERLA